MKYVIVSLILAIAIQNQMLSQEESTLSKKEQKQLAKEKRQAEKAARDERAKEITRLMLEHHKFVLEANYISDGKGHRQPVSSNLNFLALDSTEATLQLGSPWGIGINGVGGITVDGRVSKYELVVHEGKKGNSYTVTMFIMTSLGTYDINMWITESGRADATVRGSVSGQLTYSGELIPLSLSKVYKATSIP